MADEVDYGSEIEAAEAPSPLNVPSGHNEIDWDDVEFNGNSSDGARYWRPHRSASVRTLGRACLSVVLFGMSRAKRQPRGKLSAHLQ